VLDVVARLRRPVQTFIDAARLVAAARHARRLARQFEIEARSDHNRSMETAIIQDKVPRRPPDRVLAETGYAANG
jgi:hypothetical protein